MSSGAKAGWIRWGAVTLSLAACGGAADDSDRVRSLRATGEVVPLARILAGILAGHPGVRVMEAELEKASAGWVYEIEYVDARHRVWTERFDARTGRRLR